MHHSLRLIRGAPGEQESALNAHAKGDDVRHEFYLINPNVAKTIKSYLNHLVQSLGNSLILKYQTVTRRVSTMKMVDRPDHPRVKSESALQCDLGAKNKESTMSTKITAWQSTRTADSGSRITEAPRFVAGTPILGGLSKR